MRRSLLLLFTPFVLTACAIEGKYSTYNKFTMLDDCGDGGTYVTLYYADSSMRIKSKINVKKGTGLEFRLKPTVKKDDAIDLKAAVVTIQGKPTHPASAWIIIPPQSYNDSEGSLTICANAPVGDYEYFVEVKGLGMIDPRARVDP